ncbi:LGFP repeat-containing protein, partial [Microbacterium sp. 22215]
MPRILATFVAVAALVVGVTVPAASASAATSASTGVVQARDVKTTLVGFSAGNIISDAVFTNKSTMTEAQIQTFFNSKVSKCQSGYVCLKDFRITSVTRPADQYCSGYKGAANESAARIIYRVAQACDINPQVLIVMLQKEQGLITHTWPSDWRYNIALGQGCPDTAPCDPNFIGFFHQIYGAARQMQIYMEGKWFQWYAPGNTWNILYNPNSACGSGRVYVANKATAALYYYTPYQPNAAALKAGYGVGNSCSAYGNRNFYNYFTDWFGSTQSSQVSEGSQAISKAWASAGGLSGSWGNRLDAPKCSGATVCGHVFQNAIAYWQQGKPLVVATGTIAKWAISKGVSKVGYPNSAAVAVTENGGGTAQSFTKVLVNAGPSGVFSLTGLTRTAHAELGGVRQSAGWPTSEKTCSSGSDRCVQTFQNAVISEVGGRALSVTDGTVLKTYNAAGGAKGILGIPTSNLVTSAASGGGKEQAFANGAVSMSGAGAYAIAGEIRKAHSRAGGVSGQLGWPLGAQSCGLAGGGCSQKFQHGTAYTIDGAGRYVAGDVFDFYAGKGGPSGALGYPLGDTVSVSANGGGTA